MRFVWAFIASGVIGMLGGVIGLGGAEFRLPVLVGLFQFSTLHAVVINLAVSLVTVCFSLVFRASAIPLAQVADSWPIIFNLLAGSLFGSYLGVHFATKINERMLNRIVFGFFGAPRFGAYFPRFRVDGRRFGAGFRRSDAARSSCGYHHRRVQQHAWGGRRRTDHTHPVVFVRG